MESSAVKPNPSRSQIALLAVLIILAGAVGAFNFWQESKRAPVRERIERGRRLVEKGNGAAAEIEWRDATRLDPQNSEAWALLGDLYLASQNWAAAQDAFTRLSQWQPEMPQVWSRLALAASHREDVATVRQAVAQALRRDQNDVDALDLQAALLARDTAWDKQIQVLERLVRLAPENPSYMMRLADTLLLRHQYSRARPLLDRLLAVAPQTAAGYSMRAEAVMNDHPTAKSLAAAEADLKKAHSLAPDHQRTVWLQGQLNLQLGRPAQAVSYFTWLVKNYPEHTPFLNDLAGAYQKAGNTTQAMALRRRIAQIAAVRDRRDVLESRLANDPNHFENNLQMGLLLLHSPAPVGTDKYIAQALRLRPTDHRAQAAARELEVLYQKHLQAGLKAVRAHDLKTADHEISRAMLLRPHDPRTTQAVQLVTQAASQEAPTTP